MSAIEARAAGWDQFALVRQFVSDKQSLYRSSAPNYAGDDTSQRLTKDSVRFLTKIGIDTIISFNEHPYKEREQVLLLNADIDYLHLSVRDTFAPTLEQLREAINFFRDKNSTLVHCGYGHGRTGTGITALQIDYENGQTLQPHAGSWKSENEVERRQQISVVAQLRNTRLQGKSKGIFDADPRKKFGIINFATGYYLTVSSNKTSIVAQSPEAVETGDPAPARGFQWDVAKDKTTSHFTFKNRTTVDRFVVTLPGGSQAVNNGPGEGENNLFTITEAQGLDRGLYIISPKQHPDRALSIKDPDPDNSLLSLQASKQVPVLLSAKDEKNNFGLWILLPVVINVPSRS